jgi:hypothetical protein
MAEDANSGDATHNNTSQGEITPKPKAVSKRKVWFCTWAAEHCGNWAQSNGLRLCQKHRRQHDEEREQRLFAASCLANISNNDQLRDEVGHAENGNASAGENFDNQAAIVYETLNDENDAIINATAIQTLHNRAIDNEGLNNEIVNATVGNVNRDLDNQQDSGDTRIRDLDGIPRQHLTNRLTVMDEQIDDLEQRVCHLQNMLHSIGNRDKRPTSNNSLIRTYQGLSNEDYAQRYAGSPLSFSERIYDEMENTQNLDKLECNDGDQKQISNKKREEVECDNGNQKQKSQKRKQRERERERERRRRRRQRGATTATADADASSELNVAEKSPSATFETFRQRRAILSQTFLQRSEGHYCTICQEQHYLLSTDLATFKTDANCTHIYCYAKLLCMMNRQSDNLKCPDCQCIASNIILHQPIRLNDAYAWNENIPQHVLGSHEGHTCTICHETYSLRDEDLGTFESKGPCNHIFCYECLSHYKNNNGPDCLKCPNCRIEAYDIVLNERRTTSPETIEMSMDDQSVFCDWAMGTMSDTGINNRHEERCICHSYHIQLRQCEHEGCNKRVHQLCQDDWLQRHMYPPEDKCYCPQHNTHYVKWVRFKAGEIPHWDIGCDYTMLPLPLPLRMP